MIKPPTIALDTLRVLLSYEPETGHLFWKTRPRHMFASDRECKRWNTRYAGKRAFPLNANGYRSGMIFRKMHRAHIVAWALFHGEWPTAFMDHINGDRDDNRICNLRLVTKSGNSRNTKLPKSNTSGVIGVAPFGRRWRAYIRDGDKNEYLGLFNSVPEAAAARKAAEQRLGYHPNHGRPT